VDIHRVADYENTHYESCFLACVAAHEEPRYQRKLPRRQATAFCPPEIESFGYRLLTGNPSFFGLTIIWLALKRA
jgi:hypothetical protein